MQVKAKSRIDTVLSLRDHCHRVVLDSLSPSTVCSGLSAAEALAPALDELQEQLLVYLAQHLPDVAACDPTGLSGLEASTIAQLLLCPSLVMTFKWLALDGYYCACLPVCVPVPNDGHIVVMRKCECLYTCRLTARALCRFAGVCREGHI